MKQALVDRVQGCLLGLKIGDAMGMPVENMSREEINKLNNGCGVLGFMSPVKSDHFYADKKNAAGMTTDDWQMARAILRSLIEERKYCFDACVRELIREHNYSNTGWNPSSNESIREFIDYFYSDGELGRDPSLPARCRGPMTGCGNGVAVRTIPLGLYFALSGEYCSSADMIDLVMCHGRSTHSDFRASIAAYAVIRLISACLIDPILYESRSADVQYQSLVRALRAAEEIYCPDEGLQLSKVLSAIQDVGLYNDFENILEVTGNSCFALESVPLAIAIFFRHANDYRAGVLEAVNAGGDTDSTAAIVGALIGANAGAISVPTEWFDYQNLFSDTLAWGAKLYLVLK